MNTAFPASAGLVLAALLTPAPLPLTGALLAGTVLREAGVIVLRPM